MADLKTGPNPLFLREEELRQGIELLFFAYRDFTAEPDEILAEIGFGRAHHRAVYFIGRYPGITVLHDLNQAARHADHIVLLQAGAVVAAGRPEDVVTAERIADVFSVAVRVVPDPVTATPMCIPLPLRHRQHASCGG